MPGRKSSKRPASRRPSKQVRSRQTRRRQRGGRVGMPIEYYGGNSGRFTGNAGASCQHAYGDGLRQSHGTDREGGALGPNLGVYPNSSLMQTGGNRKRKGARKGARKSVRKNVRKTVRKNVRKTRKVVRRRRRSK